MLTWAAWALGACVLVIVIHWLITRVDGLGRTKGFPFVSVVLVSALTVLAAAPGIQRSNLEHRLAKAASTLVGVKVTVHCQTFGGAFIDTHADLGHVMFRDGVPEHATLIKYEQCADLKAYLKSGKHHPSHSQVVAVHVLTHEAMHMAGQIVEAHAECEAVQRDAATARLLGAGADDAAALARAYWRSAYPFMPDDYRDGGCRAGGTLDERLGDGPWAS